MNTSGPTPIKRIRLLWRGDHGDDHRSDRVETMLGALFDAFAELGVGVEHVVDNAVDEVREELLGLDGVLVWVNPIQDGCGEYFAWSGSLISQPYQMRLQDGMIRCYFVHNKVVGFCHQWPKGLLDARDLERDATTPAPSRSLMEDAATPRYASLRTKAESEWAPAMKKLLDLDGQSLRVIFGCGLLV